MNSTVDSYSTATRSLTEEIRTAIGFLERLAVILDDAHMLSDATDCRMRARTLGEAFDRTDATQKPTVEGFSAEDPLPCDVAVAPSAIFSAGCTLGDVLRTIRSRYGAPDQHFRRAIIQRVLPSEVVQGVVERMRWFALRQDKRSELHAVLLEGAQRIGEQMVRLQEARAVFHHIQGSVEPARLGLVKRWLNELPMGMDAPLTLGHHPLDDHWVYGYTIGGDWFHDLFASVDTPVDPCQDYGLTVEEISAWEKAN